MGPSGFPFPSFISTTSDNELDIAVAPAASLSSPKILSPDGDSLYSPLAATPQDERDSNVLPSVVSPFSAAHTRSVWGVPSPADPSVVGHESYSPSQGMSCQNPVNLSLNSQIMTPNSPLPTPPHEKRPNLGLPSFSELGISVYSLTGPNSGPMESRPLEMMIITPTTESPGGSWPLDVREFSGAEGEFSPASPSGLQTGTPISTSIQEPGGMSSGAESVELLHDIMQAIVSKFRNQDSEPRSIRVLSHALPFPRVPGHCFPWILELVKNHHSSSFLTWISHLHAVPHRFNVSDLPTSPPSTPGQPFGSNDGTSEDYFTTKTFESAVEAMDYSTFLEGLIAQPTSGSPRSSFQQELAAPSSLDLVIVERYIPPPTSREFTSLYSMTRPSLLLDRFYELLPGNGCVVFIYPTKTGAQTFCNEILGPIIDPLLRGLAVVKGFSADLSKAIGTMGAVSKMCEFEGLKRSIVEVCNDMRQASMSNPKVRQRLCGGSAKFSLICAEKKYISLSREVWSDWWIRQEKTRIRQELYQHLRLSHADTTPTQLSQEIFDGVRNRPYPAGREPLGARVEVGIFVVNRSI